MDTPPFCDKRIVTALLGNDLKKRNSTLLYLYNSCYPAVQAFILKNSGFEEDAADIFQEAIIILNKKVAANEFRGSSTIRTYLIAIAKKLWFKELRKSYKRVRTPLDPGCEEILAKQNSEPDLSLEKLINQMVSHLCEDCKEVIADFYYSGLSMKEIMEKHKLGSEQAAKNKKYRCLKKLATLLKNNTK